MNIGLPTRRALLLAPALTLAFPAAGATEGLAGLVEPAMRLAGGPSGGLTVALTLDACPGAFDHRIAGALIEAHVPATIFVSGPWLRRNPEALALLLAHRDLFAIQNHGAAHVPPVLGARRVFGLAVAGTLDAVRREVAGGAAEVRAATGVQPRWYRAATGFYSPPALEAVRRMGVGIAGYCLNADQGASLPARVVAARIAAAADRDVIVAHVNQPLRSSGLGVVQGVAALRRRGARFVRLDRSGEGDGLQG
jgi:peptidoglycan/xylan/chitin deacetylase (PgdA/CDA1 family)